jgi:lipopolysaccharide/colanic/teichoic acid biosynthesis glycosyltransferase
MARPQESIEHGLSPAAARTKRALDVAVAMLALLVVGPLLVLTAVAIKLDSPGPVIFRQTRVGRRGRRFQILKLRTMVADAEERKRGLLHRNEAAAGLFKIADDPRITRTGRLLRRSCLDELPQLINVLRGDMSLVGPRPLVVDEDAQIKGAGRARLALTPGITGHWQIAGSSRVPLDEMVVIDRRYAHGWSLWTDCKVLARTVPHVLARRGL